MFAILQVQNLFTINHIYNHLCLKKLLQNMLVLFIIASNFICFWKNDTLPEFEKLSKMWRFFVLANLFNKFMDHKIFYLIFKTA